MSTVYSALAAAAGTGGLQAWIKSNIVPLLLLVIAVMLFVLAQRGDNAKAMKVVAGVRSPNPRMIRVSNRVDRNERPPSGRGR